MHMIAQQSRTDHHDHHPGPLKKTNNYVHQQDIVTQKESVGIFCSSEIHLHSLSTKLAAAAAAQCRLH